MRIVSVSITVLLAAVAVGAATFTDLSAFVAHTGPNSIATFDDLAVGTSAPFTSGGASFSNVTGGATALNSLVGLPHSFWFGSGGSGANFLGTLFGYTASFSANQSAFGVLMACFGCDTAANDSSISWTLFSGPSGTGSVVGTGSQVVNFLNGFGNNARFVGVTSTLPFQSVVIDKNVVGADFHGGTYLVDDFRFAATAINNPEPAYTVPLIAALVGMFYWRTRRTATSS